TSPYSPLDPSSRTIRLLHIHSKLHVDDSRIQCSLVKVSLNDSPAYKALSYAWGEPDELGLKIWLNGKLKDVRRNLWNALRVLRLRVEGDRVIWIDALCINQEDVEERNYQVGLMSYVYSEVKLVIAWLGMPYELGIGTKQELVEYVAAADLELLTSTLAFELLDEIVDCVEPHWFEYFRSDNRPSFCRDKFLDNPDFHEHWRELVILFSAPYWKRLWTFQEVLLSVRLEIWLGKSHCAWESWKRIYTDLKSSFIMRSPPQSRPITITKSTSEIVTALFDNIAMEHFRGVLYFSQRSYCLEPRDKVYGLVGLLDRWVQNTITVDYSRSLFQLF
ncbi:heterokaryon incompatibility protein-domain-containing protein, partial [Leptodontidium sp. MPI-SDFR-AT-0119]